MSGSRTAVLVHGAWHGAWCWELVGQRLDAASVPYVALDLAGRDRDAGLDDDAAVVRAAHDAVDGDVVLVGHSYGGAVITDAGDHSAVSHLIYLCAFALDDGETCLSAAAGDPAAASINHDGRPDMGAGFRVGDDGLVTLDPGIATTCFFNDCDPSVTTWALERLTAHPLRSLQQPPRSVAWRARPSTYVVGADDLAVHPDLQRILARRCTTAVEWPTGHSPFLSRPDLVADLIVERCR
jgi:pimeloyl-ACP methyl ester carboxylesterase